MKKRLIKILLPLLSAALVTVDQITKYMAVTVLRDGAQRSVQVIPGLLEFTYLENTAAAMGLFGGMVWLIMILCAAVSVLLLLSIFLYNNHTWASYSAIVLVLAGGIGNLIDRFINLGPAGERYVVDFIHVEFFPYIFNFADCCVTIGAAFFVIHFIILTRREKKPAREET